MKKLIVLCGKKCPYCKKAKMLVKRALEKYTKYLAVDVRFVLEGTKEAKELAHTLVPAFFCDRKLFFEGNPDIVTVLAALENCYK